MLKNKRIKKIIQITSTTNQLPNNLIYKKLNHSHSNIPSLAQKFLINVARASVYFNQKQLLKKKITVPKFH